MSVQTQVSKDLFAINVLLDIQTLLPTQEMTLKRKRVWSESQINSTKRHTKQQSDINNYGDIQRYSPVYFHSSKSLWVSIIGFGASCLPRPRGQLCKQGNQNFKTDARLETTASYFEAKAQWSDVSLWRVGWENILKRKWTPMWLKYLVVVFWFPNPHHESKCMRFRRRANSGCLVHSLGSQLEEI